MYPDKNREEKAMLRQAQQPGRLEGEKTKERTNNAVSRRFSTGEQL
jgi:hypothetical protein